MSETPKKFTLTYEIANFGECSDGYSTLETHFNIPWQIRVKNPEVDTTKRGVFLRCCKDKGSNLWSVRTSLKFTLKSASSEKELVCNPHEFDSESCSWGKTVPLGQPLLDNFTPEETVTVTCEVTIEKMIGIRQKRKMNFEEADGKMTDVVLVVEEKKFHVSKVMLATFSPVFRSMFFGDFRESEESEVLIKDADANIFEVFIALIYSSKPDITKNNVEQLLELADRYEVEVVESKCEKWLMNTEDVEMKEKLRLAGEYILPDLQKKCLDTLKTKEDVKKLNVKSSEMNEATAKALFSKLIDF